MSAFSGLGGRVRGLFADKKGPWGSSGGDGDGGETPPPGGAGPWGEPQRGPRRSGLGSTPSVTSLEELLRRGRLRFGGGGDGGHAPDRSLIYWGVAAFILLWLVFTSFHSVSPGQRGVVSR